MQNQVQRYEIASQGDEDLVKMIQEEGRIILEIAKKEFNQIKIKQQQTQQIDNYQEIIRILKTQKKQKTNKPHQSLSFQNLSDTAAQANTDPKKLEAHCGLHSGSLKQGSMISMEISNGFAEHQASNTANLPQNLIESLQNEQDNSEKSSVCYKDKGLQKKSCSSEQNPYLVPQDHALIIDTYQRVYLKTPLQNKEGQPSSSQNHNSRANYIVAMDEKPQFMNMSMTTDNRILMKDPQKGYHYQRLGINHQISPFWTDLIYVSYHIEWESILISDQFLWPKSNRSVSDMKIYAADFLSDFLKKDFHKYECHQIEWPQLSNSRGKEHLFEITLDITWDQEHLKDRFLWDISDPDNSPEEFAAQMTQDLQLPQIFVNLIALQIRRQISNYVLKSAQFFQKGVQGHKDFEMPITFVSLKQSQLKIEDNQEEAYHLRPKSNQRVDLEQMLPKKRLRSESKDLDSQMTEDLLFRVNLALQHRNFKPQEAYSQSQIAESSINSNAANQNNNESLSIKLTPQKRKSNNLTHEVCQQIAIEPGNTKISLKNLIYGQSDSNQIQNGEIKAKQNQSKVQKSPAKFDSQVLHNLQTSQIQDRSPQKSQNLSNKIQIPIDSKVQNDLSKNHIIKIPNIVREANISTQQRPDQEKNGTNRGSSKQLMLSAQKIKSPQKHAENGINQIFLEHPNQQIAFIQADHEHQMFQACKTQMVDTNCMVENSLVTTQANSHLISIDLKPLIKKGTNSSHEKSFKQNDQVQVDFNGDTHHMVNRGSQSGKNL